jgi:hypothetical protein
MNHDKEINVTLTETEAELLMLAIIEIKGKWDSNNNVNMKKNHIESISKNYESIIDKVKIGLKINIYGKDF